MQEETEQQSKSKALHLEQLQSQFQSSEETERVRPAHNPET